MKRRFLARRSAPGTIVACVVIVVALAGTTIAATGGASKIVAVKIRCSATRAGKKVPCRVVGRAPRGARGPQGAQGPQGPQGAKGDAGTNALAGPLTLTQQPAFQLVPTQVSSGYLTAIQPKNHKQSGPDPYAPQQETIAESNNVLDDQQQDLLMALLSPSQVGGRATRVTAVDFCINIAPNSNVPYPGSSSVAVDKVSVVEVKEPKPAGGAASGTIDGGAPAYAAPVPVLQQAFTGQTQISDCLTASAPSAPAVDPGALLYLDITLGYSTSGKANNTFGTNYIDLGRVTTTYAP